ncbi:hypothetical protein HMPREF1991_01277 [Hoylesella loescheii DSM 19665 = JCM 12249 = ATCC 15930]|uniref:Uncharacterized protein n=1 Tax=Hoylesella loescheii DSM 19665 = JCM 12249 = ATCC 15930 TaxID=1122985 RepID=A0A069QL14_HOYLO|nr:hypothetical protein HMPREF1991_01277 [Hoylesella loescheii DSM 19665 = JCM 12249 = ATCC 15930]
MPISSFFAFSNAQQLYLEGFIGGYLLGCRDFLLTLQQWFNRFALCEKRNVEYQKRPCTGA